LRHAGRQPRQRPSARRARQRGRPPGKVSCSRPGGRRPAWRSSGRDSGSAESFEAERVGDGRGKACHAAAARAV